jgi:hypothetical protein
MVTRAHPRSPAPLHRTHDDQVHSADSSKNQRRRFGNRHKAELGFAVGESPDNLPTIGVEALRRIGAGAWHVERREHPADVQEAVGAMVIGKAGLCCFFLLRQEINHDARTGAGFPNREAVKS